MQLADGMCCGAERGWTGSVAGDLVAAAVVNQEPPPTGAEDREVLSSSSGK